MNTLGKPRISKLATKNWKVMVISTSVRPEPYLSKQLTWPHSAFHSSHSLLWVVPSPSIKDLKLTPSSKKVMWWSVFTQAFEGLPYGFWHSTSGEFNVRAIFKVIELSFFGFKNAAKTWIQSLTLNSFISAL